MNKKLQFLLFLSMVFNQANFAQFKVFGNIRNGNDDNLFSVKVILASADEKKYIHQVHTDKSGNFILNSKEKTGKLILKLPGYKTTYKFIEFTQNKLDVGTIYLEEDLLKNLETESALVDLAFLRKSPTATNTIFESTEFNHNSNKDFIERASLLPGVYTTGLGGSYSKTRLRLRGYNQNNITPLLDGISLRDFESGEVNWLLIAPASDALDAIQIQRGLGSSKLVNASVAGTVNFLLRDPFTKYDNYISVESGNNDYRKYSLNLNTGNVDKGFGLNLSLSNTSSAGYFPGTAFNATGYYLGMGYKTDKHKFTLKLLGAPSWVDFRNRISTISDIATNSGLNTSYNATYNNYNGKNIALNNQASHTPTLSLEWQYKINSNNILALKGYGVYGNTSFKDYTGTDVFGESSDLLDSNNTIDYNYIAAYNRGLKPNVLIKNDQPVTYFREPYVINGKKLFLNSSEFNTKNSGVSQTENFSKTQVYGSLVNYSTNLTSKLKLDVGLDLRKTVSRHTKYLNDLFGADGYLVDQLQNKSIYTTETFSLKDDLWNPFKTIKTIKVDYYKENITWYYGAYSQLQLNLKNFNFLLQGGYSENDFSKVTYDIFNTNLSESSNHVNLDSYNVKFGANWNVNSKNNIWFNAGLVSRVPILNYVFDFGTNKIKDGFKNENFESVEAGYTFLSKNFNLNLIAYMNYLDNSTEQLFETGYGVTGFTHDLSKRNSGVELDFTYKPFNRFTIYSSHSFGEGVYTKDAKYIEYDNNQTTNLYIKDTRIGSVPEWMSSLSLLIEPVRRLSFTLTGKYHDNFYSNTPAEQYDPVWYPKSYAVNDLKLPSFLLFDTSLKYKIKLNNEDLVNVGLSMNNIFDTLYITESTRSYLNNQNVPGTNSTYGSVFPANFKGINGANTAFFGSGRTWNFAVQYRF
ncbi:TonB-dependent receptor plug domain-containing protein [Flavobacterium davisii]|uniref:TonB-dependent receptor plug domain-containing protein n=1 Tax=Flavobacterium davisii TaxID=2906077 RepID=UPI0035D120C9